jgi:hypothetical protein
MVWFRQDMPHVLNAMTFTPSLWEGPPFIANGNGKTIVATGVDGLKEV